MAEEVVSSEEDSRRQCQISRQGAHHVGVYRP